MLLTLEVISANGSALGANRRKVVGAEGARIGRSRENDWVIQDQHVSREHARVRCVNGAFYVEGVGRNPLAINDPNHTVPNNEPQLLHAGDRFFIDEFEISVMLSREPGAAQTPDDPFAEPQSPYASTRSDTWDESVSVPTGEAGTLDPLVALGISQLSKPSELSPVSLHQGSVLDDGFKPPRARSGQPSVRQLIPDGWDKSLIAELEAAGSRRRYEPQQKAQPAKAAAPDTLPNTMPRQPMPPPPRASQALAPQATYRDSRTPQDATGAGSLEELLSAAGLPEVQVAPETAQELGEVLRLVTQGVMEVLRARAEIKSNLRMPLTRVQVSENNPLKFAPDVVAALTALLVERDPGYLSTPRAFQDAFADIRNHQLALLEGIRAAFNAMLQHFDPGYLEREFNRQSTGGGLLKMGTRARFRDMYVTHFQRLGAYPDESFRRLFGEYFAEAYEQQLEKLKPPRG